MLRDKKIPTALENIYIYAIESMERKPHLFRKQIIIHDEKFADTINFLDQLYIGEDRSLVIWTIIASTLAELLYVNREPGLGLFVANAAHTYITQFQDEEGYFVRYFPLKGSYNSETPVDQVTREIEAITHQKMVFMYLQRFFVILHEIGHLIYENDQDWKKGWNEIESRYLHPSYWIHELTSVILSHPGKHPADEYINKAEDRIEAMATEISCDWFAFASLVLNKDKLNVALEDAIRGYWRFLLFCELIELLKKFAYIWSSAKQKADHPSDFTKFSVRIKSFISILENPDYAINIFQDTHAIFIQEALKEVNLTKLIHEFKEGFDLSRLIFSLGFWGTANPYLLNKGIQSEEIQRLHSLYFNESFLGFDRESDLTRKAPCFQAAMDFLTLCSGWVHQYFTDEDIQREYTKNAANTSESSARTILNKPYLDVTKNKARLKYAFLNYG
jgi:hypothetical protein